MKKAFREILLIWKNCFLFGKWYLQPVYLILGIIWFIPSLIILTLLYNIIDNNDDIFPSATEDDEFGDLSI